MRGAVIVVTLLVISLSPGHGTAAAQSADPTAALTARSAIVVLGTVVRVNASEEPLLAPASSTVVIKIAKMYAGSEFAGDQAGHTATVILSKPESVKVGASLLFFGNPRFIGKTLTIADEGELAPPRTEAALLQGIQSRRDAPIRARLALAGMVFRGKVESVRPLEGPDGNEKNPRLRDEHDPDWHMAMVHVTSAMRGTQNNAVVPVVFPASGDILWINVAKLHPGEEVLVLGHRPQEDEMRLMRSGKVLSQVEEARAVVVSKPFDVLPVAEEKRLVGLMQEVK